MKAADLLLLGSTAALWIACTTNAAEPIRSEAPFSAAGVKAVLDSMNMHYHDRFRDSTTAYFTARYTSDACVMAPNMPRVCGVEGIAAFYWNGGNSQDISLDIKGEEVSGTGTEVTEVGNYRVLDDEGTVLDEGKFIAIYRSEDGGWKVHREIWNSDRTEEPAAGVSATQEG